MIDSLNASVRGFAAGLAFAACCSLMLWLDQGRSEILAATIDFAAGLPVVFARRLGLPSPIFQLLFFVYWGLNGAAVARFFCRRFSPSR